MHYKIPLFDLNFDSEEEKAVCETIRSKWISMGSKTIEFEDNFKKLIGARYSVALANCTVSLHLAMKILGISEGDEVICPSLTFVATVNAIRYVNATPVFCDIINHDNLTIDPENIAQLITKRTKAIIVMHYGGFPCEMNIIMQTAKNHGIKVIEDASHSPLSVYGDKKLGAIGDIGCFSFFANKNISTGEGGMLVTNNRDYYDKAILLRSHGMTSLSYERSKGHSTSYDVVDLGYNYRMDDIRAAIGLVQLNKIRKDLEIRKQLRKLYIKYLNHIDGIIIPFKNHNEFCSNYIFPIILKDSNSVKRDLFRDKLHMQGIQTSVHYPAVHKFSIYKNYSSHLPITEYVSDNEVTLPLYSGLRKEQIEGISKIIDESI